VIDESWYMKPEGVPVHEAAGGIIVRPDEGRLMVAFIREEDFTTLVLPKGHVDPGESPEEAALREIEEESGLNHLRFICPLGIRERLNFARTSWKRTHYFLYTTGQVDARPTDPNHPHGPVWHPLDDLPEMMWPEQHDLIVSSREVIASRIRMP